MQPPVFIPLVRLVKSPTNPRTEFDEGKLRELAEDIKKEFLQALIVRPLWCQGCHTAADLDARRPKEWDGAYEIVDGERRFRASGPKFAALAEVPCDVREFTDTRVVEIQLITYLLKEQLTALEEAKGFRDLLNLKDGAGTALHTVQTIAASVHKEDNYVYVRLKMLDLPEVGRTALAEGRIGVSLARLIARIPNKEDRKVAAKDICTGGRDGEAMSRRDAEAYVAERYMQELKGAPFDTDDAELDPKAGACAACPLRTGNNKALFGDVKRGDICTNPTCYRTKCGLVFTRLSAAAKAEGAKVLTGKAAEEIFQGHDGVSLRYDSPYVDFTVKPAEGIVKHGVDRDKLPTWGELTDGRSVPLVVVQDRSGRTRTLAERTLAITAAKENGEDIFVSGLAGERAPVDASVRAAQKRADAAQKKQLAIALAASKALGNAIIQSAVPFGDSDSNAFETALMWLALDHAGADGAWFLLKRYGVKKEASETTDKACLKLLRKLPANEHLAAAVELLCARDIRFSGVDKSEHFQALAKALGVDLDQVKAGVAESLKAPPAKAGKGKPVETVTADKKTLAEWVKAHAAGLPVAEIARSYKASIEDVRGALGLDEPKKPVSPKKAKPKPPAKKAAKGGKKK